jgi:hypothetical protein
MTSRLDDAAAEGDSSVSIMRPQGGDAHLAEMT